MNIGIDVGGTNLRAGVVDGEGRILSIARTPVGTLSSPQSLIDRLAALSRQAMEQAHVSLEQVRSVGVGIPGAVGEGKILYTCNLPLKDVPFEALFRQHLDLPVYLANDADCAAVGEWLYGCGQGCRDFVMLTIGTGLGGGFILGGRLYCGGGMAGEVGHMVIQRRGQPCGCGRKGCWEAYCSATGLIRRTREKMDASAGSLLHAVAAEQGGVEGSTAFIAAGRGDAAAIELCAEYAKDLSLGLTNLVNILQPQVVAIGGGVAQAPEELLLNPVRQQIEAVCYTRQIGIVPQVMTARLGGDAGIIGAASLEKVKAGAHGLDAGL